MEQSGYHTTYLVVSRTPENNRVAYFDFLALFVKESQFDALCTPLNVAEIFWLQVHPVGVHVLYCTIFYKNINHGVATTFYTQPALVYNIIIKLQRIEYEETEKSEQRIGYSGGRNRRNGNHSDLEPSSSGGFFDRISCHNGGRSRYYHNRRLNHIFRNNLSRPYQNGAGCGVVQM